MRPKNDIDIEALRAHIAVIGSDVLPSGLPDPYPDRSPYAEFRSSWRRWRKILADPPKTPALQELLQLKGWDPANKTDEDIRWEAHERALETGGPMLERLSPGERFEFDVRRWESILREPPQLRQLREQWQLADWNPANRARFEVEFYAIRCAFNQISRPRPEGADKPAQDALAAIWAARTSITEFRKSLDPSSTTPALQAEVDGLDAEIASRLVA